MFLKLHPDMFDNYNNNIFINGDKYVDIKDCKM